MVHVSRFTLWNVSTVFALVHNVTQTACGRYENVLKPRALRIWLRAWRLAKM